MALTRKHLPGGCHEEGPKNLTVDRMLACKSLVVNPERWGLIEEGSQTSTIQQHETSEMLDSVRRIHLLSRCRRSVRAIAFYDRYVNKHLIILTIKLG